MIDARKLAFVVVARRRSIHVGTAVDDELLERGSVGIGSYCGVGDGFGCASDDELAVGGKSGAVSESEDTIVFPNIIRVNASYGLQRYGRTIVGVVWIAVAKLQGDGVLAVVENEAAREMDGGAGMEGYLDASVVGFHIGVTAVHGCERPVIELSRRHPCGKFVCRIHIELVGVLWIGFNDEMVLHISRHSA